MFSQPLFILKHFFSSTNILKSEAIKYILISGLIALLILSLGVYGIYHFSDFAASIITGLIPWEWAKNSSVIGMAIGILVGILFIMVIKYIILISLSPILSYISEKTEKRINREYKVAGFSIATSAARSIRVNSRNLVKEIFLTILLFFVGLIPGLNLFVLPLIFIVQAYFAGFGIMDFHLERHLTFKQTLVEVYKHKWAAITLGSIFLVIMVIPVFGVILAPYLTTVAGTKYFLEQEKISPNT